MGKNKVIDFYNNNLVKKAKQISEFRSAMPRQKMLEILNYQREIFNESITDATRYYRYA